ncbi:uncharacterized protein PpBr36_09223 [Pyricularia pennisetigena]|uniref:uncharacterized protein n=1 Tax=Pyricularia pennisetigena TaxID=1578925 RepID=UPI00115464F8|nr:uncharacterized protein PpBr36_09223 [Pyricularia pennisetigena]TLS22122.1 hypothetical protein PpBr36_09223 [Pyricularia pennisetigena]
MSSSPRFWAGPLRYCRWAARERPAYFWSVVIGSMGPVTLLVVPPIRYRLGDVDAPEIPMTYPIPRGPRKKLTGYDDDTETA